MNIRKNVKQFIDQSESPTPHHFFILFLLYVQRKDRKNGEGERPENRIRNRPISMTTKLGSGHIEQQVSYQYDERGNMTKLDDLVNTYRTQEFVYDALDRLVKAKGKYGEENYEYSAGGNLLKRGQFTLYYEDGNHKQAVTKVHSEQTGILHYNYDASGNLISRNGDSLYYDSLGKMKELVQAGAGNTIEYVYDASGIRVKKKMQNVTSYSLFGGNYEITREASKPETHTIYIRGLQNDLLAQMTRDNAVLLGSGSVGNSLVGNRELGMGVVLKYSPLSLLFGDCTETGVDCAEYRDNKFKAGLKKIALLLIIPENRVVRDAISWGIVLIISILLVFLINGAIPNAQTLFPRLTASVLSVAILFTFTQCGTATSSKSEGEAPWFLIASGVNSRTPSVSNGGTTSGSNTPSPIPYSQIIIPVTGLFFIHPDHLGSTTMITDGYGNPVSGGEYGGKSHISYKPYGEILRTDSSGPDISKFKYTGQIEDKETGLMYYKARYYDPMLARFTQADSVVRSDALSGMNLYMYVDGNPVRYIDPTGHKPSKAIMGAAIGYLYAEHFGMTKEQGAMVGFAMNYGQKRNSENRWKRSDLNITLNKTEHFLGKVFGKKLTNYFTNIGNVIHGRKYEEVTKDGANLKALHMWASFHCPGGSVNATVCLLIFAHTHNKLSRRNKDMVLGISPLFGFKFNLKPPTEGAGSCSKEYSYGAGVDYVSNMSKSSRYPHSTSNESNAGNENPASPGNGIQLATAACIKKTEDGD